MSKEISGKSKKSQAVPLFPRTMLNVKIFLRFFYDHSWKSCNTVRTPFKTNPPDLGDSYSTALVQYHKLESRLNRNPGLVKPYHDFLFEYLKLGHMTPDLSFSDKIRYFLSHYLIIRKSSSTNKLRVVFNASARSQNGNSLNDCMFTGPKLQQEHLI